MSAAVDARPSAVTAGLTALVDHCIAYGHELSQRGQFIEAERIFRAAIDLDPNRAMAHNNLGWTLQMQGRVDQAVATYRRALDLEPRLRIARRNLALELLRQGQRDESMQLWRAELSDVQGFEWFQNLIATTMTSSRDLTPVGEYAAILAELRWGSEWFPSRRDSTQPPPRDVPRNQLSVAKLRHDVEQFLYLQRRGVLGSGFSAIVRDYECVIDRLLEHGADARAPLEGEFRTLIGHVYNRIVNIRQTPRVERALSGGWDAAAVERQYLDRPPGVVVVDDFLSREALQNLRAFCLESTVWSANRYAYGRLGAFFHDGFNCPLLLQIAEELREALPRMIGSRYPLRQVWGFKNDRELPRNATTHADFAAVNVNFWITPTQANLDESTGGLVVYGIDAPLHWDFATYNGRSDIIKPFLQQQKATSVTIPYRQNRAVIFNSDLFHGTDGLSFRSEYENRRINVTMLYGDREQDSQRIHRESASSTSAWRSAAIRRSRWS